MTKFVMALVVLSSLYLAGCGGAEPDDPAASLPVPQELRDAPPGQTQGREPPEHLQRMHDDWAGSGN